MSENVPPFQWSASKERAALLVAEDLLREDEIAAAANVTDRQVRRWKQHPDFMARVATHLQAQYDAILAVGIANKQRRVAVLDERWRLQRRVILERAADPEMADVPGGTTGLLVRTFKALGRGDDFRVVEEYAVDTGLLTELRATEKQAAQETGQWVDKVAPTDPTGEHPYDAFGDDEIRAEARAIIERQGTPDPDGGDPA